MPYYEAQRVLIENNLLIGNSLNKIRSPFQVMNAADVTIRANTVTGNLPALEFGMRIFGYGDGAPGNTRIHLHNNLWSDPTGTMGDTFNRGDSTTGLTFDNNLFWNAGRPFPTSGESIIEVNDDAHRVAGDPLLGGQAGLVLPGWDPDLGKFKDGSATIRQVFERLVAFYGTPASNSPAANAADPAWMPADDILGRSRRAGGAPDIGAVEFAPALELYGIPGDKRIHLVWSANINLPSETTWRIEYQGPPGVPPSPIDNLPGSTRQFTLNGLANYTLYTVTVKAIQGGLSILEDTVQVTPTDQIVYLPYLDL
jgi:hypothetical protein